MSYVGFGLRNSVGLGLGGIPSLLNAPKGAPSPTIDNALLQENNDFLLQENGDYILLESA